MYQWLARKYLSRNLFQSASRSKSFSYFKVKPLQNAKSFMENLMLQDNLWQAEGSIMFMSLSIYITFGAILCYIQRFKLFLDLLYLLHEFFVQACFTVVVVILPRLWMIVPHLTHLILLPPLFPFPITSASTITINQATQRLPPQAPATTPTTPLRTEPRTPARSTGASQRTAPMRGTTSKVRHRVLSWYWHPSYRAVDGKCTTPLGLGLPFSASKALFFTLHDRSLSTSQSS